MSIAENIKRLREINGVTQKELARVAGVTENAVSKWENGYSEPRMGPIERMAACYGLSKMHIIEDNGMSLVDPLTKRPLPKGATIPAGSTATAPLLGWVHAGNPEDERVLDDEIQVPQYVLDAHPNGFFLRVEGDCMDRRYPEGCYVFVDPDLAPWNGCAAAVELSNYDGVLRIWHKGQTTLMLTADSFAEYDDIVLTDQTPVRVIGVIVWFQADKMIECPDGEA